MARGRRPYAAGQGWDTVGKEGGLESSQVFKSNVHRKGSFTSALAVSDNEGFELTAPSRLAAKFPSKFFLFFFKSVYVVMYIVEYRCSQSPKDGAGSPGAGVTHGWSSVHNTLPSAGDKARETPSKCHSEY